MTDDAGAAVAAAEPVAQPAETGSQPADTGPSAAERSKEPARASIDRAFAQLDKEQGTAQPTKDTKPKETKTDAPATGERERDESGRFKAKEAAPAIEPEAQPQPEAKTSVEKPAAIASEPPARFSSDAKAAWKDAPPAVQGEITRAIKELEGGISQYQAMLEPLKGHFALAKQHGTTIHEALDGYLTVERSLRSQDMQQKMTALAGIFETAGISPRDYAAHIMGQKPDQVQSQNDQTIRDLRNHISRLEQQIGGVTSSIEQRRQDDVRAQVDAFAKDHPRMQDEAFAGEVAALIRTGYAKDLSDAYDKAERLNPLPVTAPQTTAASSAAPTKPQTDQTRNKANLSIAGAPTSGSNPVARKSPASARESLDRAFASIGIS